ncbi:hypothetical protein [Nocardioides sambongensis]|uniref:hypothetical protein n=1 Tax=Nocardioides sambongensis TaxID=2589074 RepID=UPI00112D7C7A|nr:hypothetical protein [Nocardioides sambongensis]
MSDVTTPGPRRRLPRPTRVAGALTAALLLAGGVLAGCGGEAATDEQAEPSATATEETGYLDTPDGVTLTEPGTELSLGETATVAWEPREGTTAVLDLTVDRIERTTFDESFQGWQIDDATAAMTPYFVRATATNVAEQDLGGIQVLLWARDDSGTLVAVQRFTDKVFRPCPSADLPAKFPAGETTQVCFVYLISPGRALTAVAFPPPQQADEVLWSGKVSTQVRPPAAEKSQEKQSKKNEQQKKDKDE